MFGSILAGARLIGRHRSLLTLIAVAAAAAALYAWGAGQRADRDRLAAWGQEVCALAQSELQPPRRRRGVDCRAAIADLASFKIRSTEETARLLAELVAERDRTSAADARAARASADRATAAAAQMETINDQVQGDRVDARWMRAFNDLAGLRRP